MRVAYYLFINAFLVMTIGCKTGKISLKSGKSKPNVESKLGGDDEGKGASSAGGAEGTDTIAPTWATHVAGNHHTVILDR